MSLNAITIQGRLVRDPEIRRTGSGLLVGNFTIAVDRDFNGQDGNKETDFIDCVAWRGTADTLGKYFRKGSMAVVVGRLQSRKWTDKDGNKRTAWEIQVEKLYFGESRKSDGGSGGYMQPHSTGGAYDGVQDYANSLGQNKPADYSYPYPGNGPSSDFALLDDDDGELPFTY